MGQMIKQNIVWLSLLEEFFIEMNTEHNDISRVYRTRAQAKKSYDRMSHYYELVAGIFEKKYTNRALKRLNIKSEETVLEIGFGTGNFPTMRIAGRYMFKKHWRKRDFLLKTEKKLNYLDYLWRLL